MVATVAVQGGTPEQEPLDVLHADRLLSSGQDVNNITNLIGNVHLRQGTTDLKATRAIWYKKTNVVVFLDSVRVTDGPRALQCQTLTYYRNSGSALAVGEVVINDSTEQMQLKASKVDYIRAQDRFIATGGPKLTLNPQSDSNKTDIEADSIIYDSPTKSGTAIKEVSIIRKNVISSSDRAEFYQGGNLIKLLGNPHVVEGENNIDGDEIDLLTTERTLTGMTVEGNARADYRSRPDSAVDEYTEAILEGKQLQVFFVGDVVARAVMRRNATSYYYPAASDTISQGKNIASGDSISLFFDNSRIYRVLVLGGAQGQYIEDKPQPDGGIKPETTFYNAEEINYMVDDGTIDLYNRAGLRYQNLGLESGDVQYRLNDQIMIATGVPLQTDSGTVIEQKPVLREDNEELKGERMTYNISTRKGKVELGETEYDKGFYRGRTLRQVDKDVLFVTSGEYTTCDLEHPHFHFYSHRMKMITRDKIMAEPVVLFIGALPVIIVPYYVFPIRKGRHSGFLAFDLGNFERGQMFIRNVGYYWAASDYWDALGSLDFYENSRLRINGNLNYNLRYNFNGNIGGSFSRSSSWSNYQRNVSLGWGLNFSHNQTISETMSLRGSGSFQSSKNYNIDNSYDQGERLNRQLRSNLSLQKRWQSESVTMAVDQTWNLDTDVKSRLLPVITFSRNMLPIFTPPSRQIKKERVLPWETPPEAPRDRWYHSIVFGITGKFENRQQQTKTGDILDWEKFKTIDSQLNLQAPQRLLGVLTVNPSATVRQTIYKIDEVHAADSADVVTDDYFRREVWSAALTMKTDMYGTVYPKVAGVTGLRHVITPSISYNYAPKTERNKEYYEFTGVGTSSSRRKNIGFGLTNLFQMKFKTGEEEKKINLFNLSTSTSYDFEKKEKRWSQLTNSLNTTALSIVKLSFSSVHDFYEENSDSFLRFNPRLVSFTGSMSFSRKIYLTGRPSQASEGNADKDKLELGAYRNEAAKSTSETGGETSLQIDISHRYTERHSQGHVTSKTRWLGTTLDLQLTAGWRIKCDFQYDLELKKTTYPVFELSRDLHCWAGEFIWRPQEPLKGYYFRIYIKQLPDIKIEQSVGGITSGLSR